MSKELPQERFRISCETDVANLGPVMSALAKIPGLAITGNELIEDVRTFNKKQKPEIGTQDVLLAWIQEHPTFKAIEFVRHLREQGRGTGSAAYPAFTALIGKGILKKVGEGLYARSDIKQLAGPKKPKKTKRAKPIVVRKKNEVSNATFLLRAASRAHGKFNSMSMKKLFEADGRAATGVGPTITSLREKRLVKQISEGQYELTDRARKRPSPAKINGAAAPAATSSTEAVTHG